MATVRLLRQKIALHAEVELAGTVRIPPTRLPTQGLAAHIVRTLVVGASVFAPLAPGGRDGHAPVRQWFTHLPRFNR